MEDHQPEATMEKAFAVVDALLASDIKTGVPVPNIAVCGQQSAGKSSLLSLLLNVLLWSAEGTATHGPTQIHSRRADTFSARVEIEYHRPVAGKKRDKFTEMPLEDDRELASILQQAGDEARRTRGGVAVRTYEELLKMNEKERLYGSDKWAEYTRNVVVLYVSGPEQPSLSIIDLPGLVSQGTDWEMTVDTARAYLCENTTLILLCMAAGGPDPDFSGPAFKVVKECDPGGTRTIGIVTKADHICTDKSGFVALIKGADKYADYQPKLCGGWWPVRLRTDEDFNKHMSTEGLIAVQNKMFSKPVWTGLAHELGRDFSWDTLHAAVKDEFEKLVAQTLPRLQARIAAEMAEVARQEAVLGPELADPCGKLFGVIALIEKELDHELRDRYVSTAKLLQCQKDFERQLKAKRPEFVPLLQADVKGEPNRPVLYLDTLHELLIKHTSARTQRPHVPRVLHELLVPQVQPWAAVSFNYNASVWTALMEIVSATVGAVCRQQETPEAAPAIIARLQKHTRSFSARADAFICAAAQDEEADVTLVDGLVGEVIENANQKFPEYFAEFQERYRAPGTGASTPAQSPLQSPLRGRITPPATPTRPRISLPALQPAGFATLCTGMSPALLGPQDPAAWPDKYAVDLVHLGAIAVQHLSWGNRGLLRNVERKVLILVCEFVAGIAAELRDELQLNVDARGQAAAKRLTAPDQDKVRMRHEVANKKRKLEHMEGILAKE